MSKPSTAAGPAAAPAANAKTTRSATSHRHLWVTAIMAVLILIPSMYGFVGKFIEFIHIYRGTSGGEFAVAPIMNYLLASTGFFFLFVWAAWHGMFRDVERPKIEMLANEELLDRREAASHLR